MLAYLLCGCTVCWIVDEGVLKRVWWCGRWCLGFLEAKYLYGKVLCKGGPLDWGCSWVTVFYRQLIGQTTFLLLFDWKFIISAYVDGLRDMSFHSIIRFRIISCWDFVKLFIFLLPFSFFTICYRRFINNPSICTHSILADCWSLCYGIC